MKKEKAFTLIELIVVLVILGIIGLIVIPIVLNVQNKAEIKARERSVDNYGKAIDLAISNYRMSNGYYPTDISQLKVEYSGNKVKCNDIVINKNGSVYLSKCYVDSIKVMDKKNTDGYYHYSTLVYDTYKIGDEITYNGMKFYVIEDSDKDSVSVTVLKAEPIKESEVDLSGLEIKTQIENSTNGYSDAYLHMQYMYKDDCVSGGNQSGCSSDYGKSSIKQLVDAWSAQKLNQKDLRRDSTGYNTRLLTFDELIANLGYIYRANTTTILGSVDTPSWVNDSNYWYWTMTPREDSNYNVWSISNSNYLSSNDSITSAYNVIRPVVTILKFSL